MAQTLNYRVGMNFEMIILFTNNNCRAQEITTWSLFRFHFPLEFWRPPPCNQCGVAELHLETLHCILRCHKLLYCNYCLSSPRVREHEEFLLLFLFFKLLLNLFSGCPTWLQKCIRKIGRCFGAYFKIKKNMSWLWLLIGRRSQVAWLSRWQ